MRTALVLGGTGQIGTPAARRLAKDGWDVTVAARGEAADVRLDRTVPGALEAAADGFDLLVDVVPYTSADATQLASLAGHVGAVIAISSAAVYGFGTGADPLPVPVPEDHEAVAPGDNDYASRKRAIEVILEEAELPTTVIRPGAVYGPHTKHSREWYFVQRVLDGRQAIVLAREGAGRFHTISADNIAELIACAAARPATRVVNAGDPNAPTALDIARAIAAAMDHDWEEVLLPGPERGNLGAHPWNVEAPFVLDMSRAEGELDYRATTTYEQAVPATIEWLIEAMADRPWNEVLTGSPYLETMFDYAAEDAFLAHRGEEAPR
jgi:nucleoside-diphosphate-sugar epimerase